MRRLGMAVAAVLLCATMGFARENRNNVSKEPFPAHFNHLTALQSTLRIQEWKPPSPAW